MKNKLIGVVSPGGKKVAELYDDMEFSATFGNLWSRWQDECKYEKIADYQKILDPYVTKVGLTIVKMTKRPFGFHVKFEDMIYAVTANGWKRIA